MDRRKLAIPTTLALLVATAGGFSSTLNAANYSYAEVRFLMDAEQKFSNADVDGDGIRFGGSYLVTKEIYAFGSYDDVSIDDFDIDITYLKLGAGYIHPLNSTWDANFSLAYVDAEASGNALVRNEDENGFELTGGVRGMIKPEVELRAELNYMDLKDSDTYFTLAGDYYFAPNISAGMEIDISGDYETMSIGAKYYFK